MKQHAFVAMPFGTKEGIDFDRVYAEYLRPALEAAGLEVFRADEEQAAGSILTDMFQELLMADLVVADLSLDNPNVWYELGVRHALRERAVILVQSGREQQPFDLYTERKLHYTVTDGAPDPATLDEDRRRLTAMVRATLAGWAGLRASPVYQLLPQLREGDWRAMLMQGENRFSAGIKEWQRRMNTARRKGLAGDVVLLAGETPTFALRVEARRAAGHCLLQLKQYGLALEQYEDALAIAPADLAARQKKALCLGRLERHDEAVEWVAHILGDHPDDAETLALKGRVDKDAWLARWHGLTGGAEQRRVAAGAALPLLRRAVLAYEQAFVQRPDHYHSAINAALLSRIERFLRQIEEPPAGQRPLDAGLAWACLSAQRRDPDDFWPRISQAESELLAAEPAQVAEAYRNALVYANRDAFALDSARQTLVMLHDLGFRPEAVAAALAAVDAEVALIDPPWRPRQVFLFSGHMIDAPGRPSPRFPADKAPLAASAIAARLDQLGAGQGDLALTQGACGGDLLFAEAALARGLRLELLLPFEEPAFLEASVAFAGQGWVDRYYAVSRSPDTRRRVMPDELGPTPAGASAFERCNLWLLYTALAWGPEAVRCIALWNGQGGDGPGGTRHMLTAVREHTGRVVEIRTDHLW